MTQSSNKKSSRVPHAELVVKSCLYDKGPFLLRAADRSAVDREFSFQEFDELPKLDFFSGAAFREMGEWLSG